MKRRSIVRIKDQTKPEGKSKYAAKLRLKYGNGKLFPNWMWWTEASDKPRRYVA